MTSVRSARPPWAEVVLVCRKCARKAGRKAFARELKSALKREGHGKTVRVVETGCLDLCPKRRLTIAARSDLDRRRVAVVSPDAPIEAVVRHVTAEPGDRQTRDDIIQFEPTDAPVAQTVFPHAGAH